MTAIALAIGSSLVYGVSDFLGDLKSRSLPLLAVLLISQASALFLLNALVIVRANGPPGGEFIVYGVLPGLAEAVGTAALYRGLAVGTMSIVAPVAATAPVVPSWWKSCSGRRPTRFRAPVSCSPSRGGIISAV